MNHRFRTLRAATALSLTLALPMVLSGCSEDDDATGPGESGTASASIYDGSESQGVAPRSAAAPASVQSSVSGNMSGSARAEIYSETQGWVSLGDATNATLALQGTETSTVGSASVSADSYTQVRLVLDGFAAHVDAGSVLGGITLGAAVDITLGDSDGQVTIERTVTPFTVSADASVDIQFDLNSEAWIDEESAESETATEAAIESATTVTVTSG